MCIPFVWRGGSVKSNKIPLRFCRNCRVFHIRHYEHVCGEAVVVVAGLRGVKRGKNKKVSTGTASGGRK